MSPINYHFEDCYQKFIDKISGEFDELELDKLSLPILMKAFKEYDVANNKILFVGRETFSWYGKMNEPEKLKTSFLMESYKNFEFAKNYKGKNSPFWRFLHDFNKRLNPNAERNSFLWTNFSKMDYEKGTPSKEMIEKLTDGFHLLKEEIKIAKPDIVLFLTSWKYDSKIKEVFTGVEFKVLEKRKLSQLYHEDLPHLTFRTYHPNYLQRSNNFDSILETLENLCLKK